MDFLKAEIERKKRQMQEKNVMAPDKKYFKRGELIEKEREEYLKKHKPKEEDVKKVESIVEAKEKSKQKRKLNQAFDSLILFKIGFISVLEKKDEPLEVPSLPRVEVVRRLRERLQPILLFGENEAQACDRLRTIEINEPEVIEGIKNDFQEALGKVDEILDKETAKGEDGSKSEHGGRSDSDLYVTTIVYDELLELINDAHKGDIEADVKLVSEFIRFMITQWGRSLEKRSPEEKTSVMGKRETGIYAQTRTYLKPLLRLLKKQTVSDDVRDSLVKMVLFTLQRDYILGHEAYMEMAVGNAPWPIGVTNAGIHARPARENIFSKNVAHVLNDETQRKYIQGLKRLMTKAQEYYPTDPSRSIDFVRKEKPKTEESN